MGFYDIMTDISELDNLVQLMDSLGNVSNAISVFGYWIFDLNYKKTLILIRESLGMIFPRLLVKKNSVSLKQYLLL